MSALADFDDKAEAVPPGGKATLATIPDGDYDFVIDEVVQKETKGGEFFRMKIIVLSDGIGHGTEIEHNYWLTGLDKETKKVVLQEWSIGNLKKDLETLGFDVPEWKKAAGRPFSAELPKAAFCMKNMKFKGKKSTNGKYANLTLVERLNDDKPKKFGPAELATAAKANAIPF